MIDADVTQMLRQLATHGGRQGFFESEEPFHPSTMQQASRLGLVEQHLTGPMARTDAVITLTAAGRRAVGMRPTVRWYEKIARIRSMVGIKSPHRGEA